MSSQRNEEQEEYYASEVKMLYDGENYREIDRILKYILQGEIPTMEDVFRVLYYFQYGQPKDTMQVPMRPTASPFLPAFGNVYLVNTKLKQVGLKDVEQISVSFQSILNSEPWWSPEMPEFGVVSRPMSRVPRGRRSSDNQHGYRGRMYTLVAKTKGLDDMKQKQEQYFLQSKDPLTHSDSNDAFFDYLSYDDSLFASTSPPAPALDIGTHTISLMTPPKTIRMVPTKTTPTYSPKEIQHRATKRQRSSLTKRDKEYSIIGNIHLVQVWRDDSLPRSEKSQKKSSILLSLGEKRKAKSYHESCSTQDKDTTIVSGNLLVQGNIRCQGQVFGTFVTPPAAADYSEWFRWHDSLCDIKKPPKGSVVQLRSPEQALTLDASGKGPIMVISSSPSVAAGVPTCSKEAINSGALVAFIGQVPIRCSGPVQVGDKLVPSGKNDGCAVTSAFRRRPTLKPGECPTCDRTDFPIVGISMVSKQTHETNLILCLVRCEHAIQRRNSTKMHCVIDNGLVQNQTQLARSLLQFIIVSALLFLIFALSFLVISFSSSTNVTTKKVIQVTISTLLYATAFVSLLLIISLLLVLRGTGFPHLLSHISFFCFAFFLAVIQLICNELVFSDIDSIFSSTWFLLGVLYHTYTLHTVFPLFKKRRLIDIIRNSIYGTVTAANHRRRSTVAIHPLT